jgi:hypothetical protein
LAIIELLDAVGDGNDGDARTELQAFPNNLGFERFGEELRWRMEILRLRAIVLALMQF